MLHENGIYDVKVESVQGQLSDHYNLTRNNQTWPDVYNGRSVAAAAVAAHETGHAVQHATAYAWLGFRFKAGSPVSFASKWCSGCFLQDNPGKHIPALLLAA